MAGAGREPEANCSVTVVDPVLKPIVYPDTNQALAVPAAAALDAQVPCPSLSPSRSLTSSLNLGLSLSLSLSVSRSLSALFLPPSLILIAAACLLPR